jgi:hypothetical protein
VRPASVRLLNPFFSRRINRSGKKKEALAVVGGYPQYIAFFDNALRAGQVRVGAVSARRGEGGARGGGVRTLTATEIVDLYLTEVGEPTWRDAEGGGICYFGAYPPKNPNVRSSYLDKDTLTRLIWDCRREAPTRSAVLDALAVLQSLATRAAMKEQVR